jgi:hypothetical protein
VVSSSVYNCNLPLTVYHLPLFFMRVIFNLLVVLASLLSLFILAALLLALIYGEFNILLPGLGLIINFPAIIIPLLIIDALIIALAFLIRRLSLKKLD